MPIVLTYIWKILNKEKVTRWRRMSAELDSQRETEEECGAVGGKLEDVEMQKQAWDWQTHWRRNCVNHSHTAAAILPGNCCKHPRSLHLGAWPWWTTTLRTFWLGARASLCLHKIEMPEPSFGVMQQSAAWKFLNITRHLSEERRQSWLIAQPMPLITKRQRAQLSEDWHYRKNKILICSSARVARPDRPGNVCGC